MDGIVRRRGMMNETAPVENWESISNNTYTSWYIQSGVVTLSGDTVIFTPASMGWTCRMVVNNRKYKWSAIKSTIKKVKVEFDYNLISISGNDARLAISPGLANNQSTGVTRGAYVSTPSLDTVGSGHYYAVVDPFVFTNGTANNDHYLACWFYFYAQSGSRLEMSNVTVEATF